MDDQVAPERRRRWSIGRRLRWLIRREWERDRLRLTGLDRQTWLLTVVALLTLGLTVAVAIVLAVGSTLPGGVLEVPGRFVAAHGPVGISVLPILFTLVSMAALSAAGAGWAILQPSAIGWFTRVGIALLGLGLWGRALSELKTIADLDAAGVADFTSLVPMIRVTGGLAVAAAAGLAILPRNLLRRGVGPVLGAAPATLALILVAVSWGVREDIPSLVEVGDFPANVAFGPAMVFGPLANDITRTAALLLLPYVLWQAATWARLSRRDAAPRIARRAERQPWLLPALLTMKLGWLGLGFAGLLPVVLGGGAEVWQRSRDDGVLAWALGVAMVVAVAAWLARRRSMPISEGGLTPAAGSVVVGMSSATILGSVLLVVAAASLLLPTAAVTSNLKAGVEASTALIGWAQLLTIALALIAGIVFMLRPRLRAVGVFLLVFGAWGLPRAIDVAPELVLGIKQSVRPLSVEPTTVDALLTVGLVILAAGWWMGRQRGARPEALTLVLVVSTLLVHTSTIMPAGTGRLGLIAGLLLPPLYSLALDSRELNRPSDARAALVLRAVTWKVTLLALVVSGIALGAVPGSTSTFAQLLFSLPFGVVLVGAAVTAMRRSRRAAAPETSDRRVVLAGVPVGAAAILALALVGAPLSGAALWSGAIGSSAIPVATAAPTARPLPTASPQALLAAYVASANERLAGDQEFLTQLGDAFRSGDFEAAKDVAERLRSTGLADLAWSTSQLALPCYEPAVRAYEASRQLAVDAADTILAALAGQADPNEIPPALLRFAEGADPYLTALAVARRACADASG